MSALTAEDAARVTFDAVKVEGGLPTLDEWQKKAMADHRATLAALMVAGMSDTEMEQHFCHGDTDEHFKMLREMGEAFLSAQKWHEAAVETMQVAHVRTMTIMARMCTKPGA